MSGKDSSKSGQNRSENVPERNELEEVRERVERSIAPLIQGKGSKEQVIERVTSIIAEESYAGPVPHPRHMQQYESICPGAADRMISMAEKVNQAQIDVVKSAQSDDSKDRRLGQLLGFGALLVIVAGTVLLAMNDKLIMSGALLSVGAAGTIARFVDGRRAPKEM